MASPFTVLQNVTLNFQQATGNTTDVWGNPQPSIATVPVQATLKIITNPDSAKLLQSRFRDQTDSIAMRGYCISPMELPAGLGEDSEAVMEWNGRSGIFHVVLVNPNYGRDGIGAFIENITGTKLVGWFTPSMEG